MSTGYNLTARSSATFAFSGQIDLGFSYLGLFARQEVSGQQYLATVVGTDALASLVVVAP